MRYWGKLLGLIAGLLSGTGFWGALSGLMIGHVIDNVRNRRSRDFFTHQQTRQALFYRTTFQVMGHLTKSKGRVTEKDIELASQLMNRMRLHGAERAAAQHAFSEGKQTGFPLRDKLRMLRHICPDHVDLARTFIEIQFQVAFTDGALHPNEWQVLNVIAEELGLSQHQFQQLISTMEGKYQSGSNSAGGSAKQGITRDHRLADALQTLGVSRSDDSITIKRAYRKLMSEHHPDKLAAKKGLPPEMMEQTKQKSQKIQAAYDLIKREMGFK